MGFTGQLGSVNLADIFQTLQVNRQTGTMTVSSPSQETVRLWFAEGMIVLCSAPTVEGRPFLLHILLRRGLAPAEALDEALRRQRQTGQALRDVLLNTGLIAEPALDELAVWCVEEIVCPIFEWQAGQFSFAEGDPPPELSGPEAIAIPAGLPTTSLVMEATRRLDEWQRIRAVIPDANALYIVDNEGRQNLRNVQTDPELLKVLRYLDGRHLLDGIAQATGLSRFDVHAIAAQLVIAGVARARSLAEIVDDALQLKQRGELPAAQALLEIALRAAPTADVQRPLAEIYEKLGQIPRAVELYLALLQQAQDAGDLAQARDYLDLLVRLSPDDPDLHFERAQILAELGNPELATQGFCTAAQGFLALKAVAKAIDACHRAKNLLPRQPDPHRYLARAYLLDGNTETAVVEYKALWHALLTEQSPRKALEALTRILDSDCKYAAVKEQVLAYARNSEAVRTSRAIRLLVYAAIGVVLGCGLVAGWWFYERHLLREEGLRRLTELEAALPHQLQELRHIALRQQLAEIRGHYGVRVPEVELRASALEAQVAEDFELRASEELKRCEALRAAGKYQEALRALDDLERTFTATRAAAAVPEARTRVRAEEIATQVYARVESAKQRWTALDWDGALAELTPVLARSDLPAALRQELTELQVEWQAALRSARRLSERAAAIQAQGDRRTALEAWRRAADPAAEGESDRAAALSRLTVLERDIAEGLARQAQGAAARGDPVACFAAIDELQALAGQARGPGPGEVLQALTLPFTVFLDSHHTTLQIARRDGAAEQLRAPPGHQGPWRQVLAWRLSERWTLTAARRGFLSQSLSVSAEARRVSADFTLVRGPKWRCELSARPVSAPRLVPGAVLVGTNRTTLEFVDPAQGTLRTLSFGDAVAELIDSLAILGQHGFLVVEQRVHAVDLAVRARAWAWPPPHESGPRLLGRLAALEHPLIPSVRLVLAPAPGELLVLAVDGERVVRYPGLRLSGEVSAAPLVDARDPLRPLVWLPLGAALLVIDCSTVTERNPPRLLASLTLSGELLTSPVPALVEQVPAILVADSRGVVSAIDARPAAGGLLRTLGSWTLESAPTSEPILAGDRTVAVLALPEGRLACLDLARPGSLRWRAPARPLSANIVGAPAIGQLGAYAVDSAGMLHAFALVDGALRWSADLGGTPVGGVLASDGALYIPTRAGQLVCFEEGDE
ncbi:MAG: DUF4388 domain-containing protein [Planctomycetota bacterium]|nr:DUF4388 domain-containing protein [Planctomycetota bacterium]